MNCCPKYKMESKRQVIRLVPPQVGAPAGEDRDSYSRMTRHSYTADRREIIPGVYQPTDVRIADDSLGTFDHGYSFAKRQTDG